MEETNKLVQYLMDCMERGRNDFEGPYFNRIERSADGSQIEVDLYIEDERSASIVLKIEKVEISDGGYMN